MKKIIFALITFLQTTSSTFAFQSQYGQDCYIYETFFQDKKDGVFVDVGAHDGVTLSNTYFFEKNHEWTGICVEPIPEVFLKLQNNRNCFCIQGCVADHTGSDQLLKISGYAEMLSGLISKYDPRHLERITREIEQHGGCYEIIDVQCYLLNDLLESRKISHVNYLSIDTEGGEFDIIASIDFSKYSIDVISVEDNYGDPRFVDFLKDKNYYLHTVKGRDLIFVNKNLVSKVK